MKILFLTSAFNGMTQRAWLELDRLDHQVSIHIAVEEDAMKAAVEEFGPDLIIAPFLKKKIPAGIWKSHTCLIVHPGIKGDRGASSLDWAILNQEKNWGITIIEASDKMDAGNIWSSHEFEMRVASKASLYRHEVTQAAMKGMLDAIQKFEEDHFEPESLDYTKPEISGCWRRSTCQDDFKFEWHETTEDILRKVRAADSDPGVLAKIAGTEYYCYGAHPEDMLQGEPGEMLARRNKAVCVGTGDKALWISHLKKEGKEAIKLPAVTVLEESALSSVPVSSLSPFDKTNGETYREIYYEQQEDVGFLHFNFYNGAMSTDQCRRLRQAFINAKEQPVKVIVLMGGHDLWSNGIHLNVIENAESSPDESWTNINAINDLIKEIILTDCHYVISAMQGNAGAGGVPFALAADKILARNGIVINPHTRMMGLYGSEYWSYLLPRRIGMEKAKKFTEQCLPWGTAVAKEIGLIDDTFGETAVTFRKEVKETAHRVAGLSWFDKLLASKRFERRKDEAFKPLEQYRKEELEHMHKNFYENNMGYREKRYCFVHKIHDPEQATSVQDTDLYSSRRKIYRRRKWESVHYEE